MNHKIGSKGPPKPPPKAPPKGPLRGTLVQPRFRGRFERYGFTEIWAREFEIARFCAEQEQRKNRPICSARTRKGTLCKAKVVYLRGRCRLHGGLSTGPQTAEGKAKVALNLLRARQ